MRIIRTLLILTLIAPFGVMGRDAIAQVGPSPQPDLSGPVDRDLLVRVALDRSPGLRAVRHRAAAMRQMGEAERKMPAPEADFQIWQIPASRPYAVGDAGMIMLGVRQPIPAPGSLSARAEAKEAAAGVEDAMLSEREREIVQEVEHAFVDYLEARELHRAHMAHHVTAARVLAVARARYTAGGMLEEVAQAEVELARIEADMAQEEAKVTSARVMLNGLLLRQPDAPLGDPVVGDPATVGESDAELIARAETKRPEVRSAQARTAARQAEARVSDTEAKWPMFSVGATYFAPTNNMPMHAYGVSVGSSLPWLWGRSRAESAANKAMTSATHLEVEEARAKIRAEVAAKAASVRAAARRYQVLRDRAVPAGKRAWEAAASGYESNRTNLVTLLMARTSVVEIEVDVIMARTAIEHALVDLDWAAGARVKRAAIAPQP